MGKLCFDVVSLRMWVEEVDVRSWQLYFGVHNSFASEGVHMKVFSVNALIWFQDGESRHYHQTWIDKASGKEAGFLRHQDVEEPCFSSVFNQILFSLVHTEESLLHTYYVEIFKHFGKMSESSFLMIRVVILGRGWAEEEVIGEEFHMWSVELVFRGDNILVEDMKAGQDIFQSRHLINFTSFRTHHHP